MVPSNAYRRDSWAEEHVYGIFLIQCYRCSCSNIMTIIRFSGTIQIHRIAYSIDPVSGLVVCMYHLRFFLLLLRFRFYHRILVMEIGRREEIRLAMWMRMCENWSIWHMYYKISSPFFFPQSEMNKNPMCYCCHHQYTKFQSKTCISRIGWITSMSTHVGDRQKACIVNEGMRQLKLQSSFHSMYVVWSVLSETLKMDSQKRLAKKKIVMTEKWRFNENHPFSSISPGPAEKQHMFSPWRRRR